MNINEGGTAMRTRRRWEPEGGAKQTGRRKVIEGRDFFEVVVDGEARWYPCKPAFTKEDCRGWSWSAALGIGLEETFDLMTPKERAEELRSLWFTRDSDRRR